MTKFRQVRFAAGLALAVAGCSSPSPETSSSTHWVTCETVADCSSVSGAAACTTGYCVDAQGTRLPAANGADAGPSPCDPLAPHELPVTLGTILGVGKDAQGTIYLADETVSATAGTIDRVFVSSGNTLYRKVIGGAGLSTIPGGVMDYSFSYTNDDGSGGGELLLERPASGPATSMALGAGGKGGTTTATLTILPSSAIQGMTLRNLPGDVDITYVGDVANGDVILVTQPRDDWDGTYKLYYGAPDSVIDRTIVSSSETRSGGIDIQFRVGTATYDATTSFVFGGDASAVGHPGPGTLDTGNGTTLTFTERLPTPTTLPGLTFTCL